MAQITIYVPNDVEDELRVRARESGKSLSAYITQAAVRAARPEAWSAEFLAVLGTWDGPFPELEDPLPERVESL